MLPQLGAAAAEADGEQAAEQLAPLLARGMRGPDEGHFDAVRAPEPAERRQEHPRLVERIGLQRRRGERFPFFFEGLEACRILDDLHPGVANLRGELSLAGDRGVGEEQGLVREARIGWPLRRGRPSSDLEIALRGHACPPGADL